jgi:hypothetical protein
LPAFQAASENLYPSARTRAGKLRQRRAGGGAKGGRPRFEDKLLFILVSQKPTPLQTMHALQCDVSQPQAHYWRHQLRPVLQHAFAALGLAPERDASRLPTSPAMLAGAPEAALDGTERRRQRPPAAPLHQEHYSAKKTTHTDKHLRWVNALTSQGISRGPTSAGRTHATQAADAAQLASPTHATLDKDPGVQG